MNVVSYTSCIFTARALRDFKPNEDLIHIPVHWDLHYILIQTLAELIMLVSSRSLQRENEVDHRIWVS